MACNFTASAQLSTPGTGAHSYARTEPFSSPEPPFLLVTWSAKRNDILRRVALGTRMGLNMSHGHTSHFPLFNRKIVSLRLCPDNDLDNLATFLELELKSVARSCGDFSEA